MNKTSAKEMARQSASTYGAGFMGHSSGLWFMQWSAVPGVKKGIPHQPTERPCLTNSSSPAKR
jgi:hypothetical protein